MLNRNRALTPSRLAGLQGLQSRRADWKMKTDNDAMTFGRYLKSKRMDKGMSLKTVAEETRIGVSTLMLIENEDLTKLPAEVFTKGFLRSYAKLVGADEQIVVERYLSDLSGLRKIKQHEADVFESNRHFWSRLFFALALMGSLVTGAIFIYDFKTRDLPASPEAAPPAAPPAPAPNPKPNPEPPLVVPIERLLLKVMAVKGTWMKVVIDGQNTEEYQLNPGDRLELEAATGFNILVGDAKGVRLTLNDKPVSVPGKSGQVVTVQLP